MTQKNETKGKLAKAQRLLKYTSILALVALILFISLIIKPDLTFDQKALDNTLYDQQDLNSIENGIHISTGFIAKEGYKTVIQNCTSCHSSQLVTQNRMNIDGWNATIKWMQETQNLWELGKSQEIIVNYLVSNYPPLEKGRRANLDNVKWYDLNK